MKNRKAAGAKVAVNSARRVEPMKLYIIRHAEYGETTVNGRTKYEAVLAAARKWGTRWTKLAREAEFIELFDETMLPREETEDKATPARSCENCGNVRCANSLVAFWWDECVESKFTKHWRPKKEG